MLSECERRMSDDPLPVSMIVMSITVHRATIVAPL